MLSSPSSPCTSTLLGNLLFNICIDTMLRSAELELNNLGVQVHYKLDGNLRECKNPNQTLITWLIMYADDTLLSSQRPRNKCNRH